MASDTEDDDQGSDAASPRQGLNMSGTAVDEPQEEDLPELPWAKLLQRVLRGNKVRRAMYWLAIFEDEVLELPTPGMEAATMMVEGEPAPEGLAGLPGRQPGSRGSSLAGSSKGSKAGSKAGSKNGSSAGRKPEAGSKTGSKAGSQTGTGDEAGSQAGVSQAGSQAEEPEEPRIVVTEAVLAERMADAGVEKAEVAARFICWLVCREEASSGEGGMRRIEEFDSRHLERIFRHHRLRRRNNAARVVLRITLMCHGDADQSTKETVGDSQRPLTPEGWAQVTRTGWALRLHTDFTPALVLTSSEKSCTQTADRVRSVLGDDIDEECEPEPTPPPDDRSVSKRTLSKRSVTKQQRRRPPEARNCDALTFPGHWKALGPESYKVVDAVVGTVRESDPRLGRQPVAGEIDVTKCLTPPVMLVGSNFLLETTLACLTCHSQSVDAMRGRFGGGGRMYGGDAVVVRSPPLCMFTGDEGNEYYKLPSDLWEEAMKRCNWEVVQHIRGSGKPSERPSVMTKNGLISAEEYDMNLNADKLNEFFLDIFGEREEEEEEEELDEGERGEDGRLLSKETDDDAASQTSRTSKTSKQSSRTKSKKPKPPKKEKYIEPGYVSDYGQQWRKYAGEPLIFSHAEMSRFVLRAGNPYRPPATHTLQALRPFVKNMRLDVVHEEDDRRSVFSQSSTMKKGMSATTGTLSLPNLAGTRGGTAGAMSHRSSKSNKSARSGRSVGSSGSRQRQSAAA